MIKCAVAGAAGRMGRRVIEAVNTTDGIELVSALEARGHPSVGQDAGVVAGIGPLRVNIGSDTAEALGPCDVMIDFTNAQASVEHLEKAVELSKAIVIGSTGFSQQHRERIQEIGPRTRSVVAPNMSVGVNVLLRVLRDVALVLGDLYDVEIVEAHHRNKVDAPSGTALRMAEVVAEALGREPQRDFVFARHGQIGPRAQGQIGLQTVRAGDIVGEHTVIFAGPGERVEITHRAHSRENFATGAVRAAVWVVGQPNGLYDMQDVLGLRS